MSSVMDTITARNKEKMAQKKAELAEKANLPEVKGDSKLQRPKPMVSAMQPIRASKDEVLFKSARPNFAFFLEGDRVQFKNGFYCTDDADIIKYIKANYVGSFVQILEEGEMQHMAKKEDVVSATLPNGEE